MKKRRIAITLLCVSVIAIAALTYSRSRAQQLRPEQTPGRAFKQEDIYEHMFRHYMFIKNKAEEMEREGKDAKLLRHMYKDEANLTDEEAAALDQVATECMSKVADLQSEANQIIARARARVPGGRLEEGENVPPPPEELSTLQQARESIVLHARERLRTTFGAKSFAQFDGFVQRKIAINMKNVPLERHQPKLHNDKPQP
jgi:hypothetical protein